MEALLWICLPVLVAGGSALLCLDDAFAELDAERSHRLGGLIAARAGNSQIVAAVPKTSDLPDVIAGLARWDDITKGTTLSAK